MWFRKTTLVAVVASLGIFVSAVPASAADAPIEKYRVDSYVKAFGVNREIATERLQRQARAVGIVASVQEILGSAYGGLSFDNETGRFRVGVADGAARGVDAGLSPSDRREKVQREFERRSLGAVVDVEGVSRSIADLERTQKSVAAAVESDGAGGSVRLSIDPRRNKVIVSVDPAAKELSPASLRQVLNGRGVAVDGAVDVVEGRAGTFDAAPAACGQPNCSFPLRGGVQINNPTIDSTCSSGFLGDVPDGRKVYMTAGHCTNRLGGSWFANLYPSNTPYSIGWRLDERFNAEGDIGMVVINSSSYWANGGFPPVINIWGYNEEYPINSSAWSYVGQTTCWTGYNSTGCMTVNAQNVSVYYSAEATWVGSLTSGVPQFGCVIGGTSGGAVSADNWAYGIISGTSGCSEVYYTDVLRAYQIWGVLPAHF